jgi:hypothetical protein
VHVDVAPAPVVVCVLFWTSVGWMFSSLLCFNVVGN